MWFPPAFFDTWWRSFHRLLSFRHSWLICTPNDKRKRHNRNIFFCCQWRHRRQGVRGVVAVAQRTRNVFWHVSCLLFYSFLYKSINKLASGIKPAPPSPRRVGEEQLLVDIVTTILLLSNGEILSAQSSKTLAFTTINISCTLPDITQLIKKPAGWGITQQQMH